MVLSSKRVFAVGSPSLAQPFSSKRNSTCVVRTRDPNETISAFDGGVEDYEIGNVTRVVPMAGL